MADERSATAASARSPSMSTPGARLPAEKRSGEPPGTRSAKCVAIFLPNLGGGGAERVCVNLANELFRRGYEVDMVLLSDEGVFRSLLNPSIRVVNLGASRIRWALVPLVQYLRSARPQACLACMWPLTALVIIGRTMARVDTQLVVAEHTTWSTSELLRNWFRKLRMRLLMHTLLPRADRIVTVSRGAADDLARFARIPREAVNVIYNPVVSDRPTTGAVPTEPAGWCQGPHRKLLAVGQLKAIKDYSTLLQAVARLRHRVDARLLILGEGECRLKLEAEIRSLGLEGLVFMPGFVKDPFPYYAQADLHVLSSYGEGLPTVLIEALAAGTPVVSTDCPSGPREILCDGKFGRLVEVANPTALADAMLDSLRTPPNRKSLLARAQDFRTELAVDEYERVLCRSDDSAT